MNLLRGNELYLKNTSFDLSAGPNRRENRVALDESLADLRRDYADAYDAHGGYLLLLHADAGLSWRVLRDALEAGLHSPFGFRWLYVACRTPGLSGGTRQEFDVLRGPDADGTPELHVAFVAGGDARWQVRGAAGDSLRPLAEAKRVALTLDDEATLQHLVTVLDALRGREVEAVSLPQLRVTLGMRPQHRDPPWDPTPDSPLGVAGAVGLVLLALLAGVLAWRSRRPIRRR